jgi:hypothetical protein
MCKNLSCDPQPFPLLTCRKICLWKNKNLSVVVAYCQKRGRKEWMNLLIFPIKKVFLHEIAEN